MRDRVRQRRGVGETRKTPRDTDVGSGYDSPSIAGTGAALGRASCATTIARVSVVVAWAVSGAHIAMTMASHKPAAYGPMLILMRNLMMVELATGRLRRGRSAAGIAIRRNGKRAFAGRSHGVEKPSGGCKAGDENGASMRDDAAVEA